MANALLPNPFLFDIARTLRRPVADERSDRYLRALLSREAVDGGIFSPVYQAQRILQPAIDVWASGWLSHVAPSGSFAKGTANKSSTDLDLFISLRSETPGSLKHAYDTLQAQMVERGYKPKRQNVSIGVTVGGWKVDLVPARLQHSFSTDHSLFHRRSNSWRKTNVLTHVHLVATSGRTSEIRILKLWRDQNRLEFPSFYLELAVMRALRSVWYGSLSHNVLTALDYLATGFHSDRFVDPANMANVISDDLTTAEKILIQRQARHSLTQQWTDIVH